MKSRLNTLLLVTEWEEDEGVEEIKALSEDVEEEIKVEETDELWESLDKVGDVKTAAKLAVKRASKNNWIVSDTSVPKSKKKRKTKV